jgi:hypothetical protein
MPTQWVNSSCAGQLCTVEGAEAITSNPLEYKKVTSNYNWGSKAPAWPYCEQPCCLGMPSATRCTVQARTSCTARHVSVQPHKGAYVPTQPTPAPAPISRSNDCTPQSTTYSSPHPPPAATQELACVRPSTHGGASVLTQSTPVPAPCAAASATTLPLRPPIPPPPHHPSRAP